MYSTQTILFAAVIGLFSIANAHMKLASPVPYGQSSLNNSPLAADGSDFPCKQRPGVYAEEGALELNKMVIGQPQTLSFIGGATHGGGSCQISITEDKEPSKSSKWEVIHSIEGGCPFASDGNLSDDAAGTGSTDFSYKIPDSINPGQYTLAWTWFNRIGNREMYMNCAPVNVLAASKKRSVRYVEQPKSKRATSLPDMFVANIGNGCSTVDSEDVKFPNPGDSIENAGALPPKAPVCPNSNVASTPADNAGAEAAPAPPSPPAGEFQQTTVTVYLPAPTSPPAPAVSANPVVPTPAPAPAPAPAVSANPVVPKPAPAPATGKSSSPGGCTSPGQSVCSPDGLQIGTCDAANRVTFINVAPGTVCRDGLMVMAKKRSARFAQGHVRRGHSLGPW
jgi:hypothetical protein